MKLQDAYAAESNQLGGWTLIGYTAPGTKGTNKYETTNFEYSSTPAWDKTEALTEAGADMKGGWIAKAKVALNDCKATSTWTLDVKGATAGVTYTNTISDPTNCTPLTPSFSQIGTKAASTTTGGEG